MAKVERSYQHVDPTRGRQRRAGWSCPSSAAGPTPSIRAEPARPSSSKASSTRASCRRSSSSSRPTGSRSRAPRRRFELLIRRHGADYVAPFRIVDYTCLVEQRDGRELLAEATVKVEVDGEIAPHRGRRQRPGQRARRRPAQGAPGVLPGARRRPPRRLQGAHPRRRRGDGRPHPGHHRLEDGARTWSTMGSDTNIIAASASALADSLEYAIWKSGAELRRRDERHFTTAPGRTRRAPAPPTARPPRPGGDRDDRTRTADRPAPRPAGRSRPAATRAAAARSSSTPATTTGGRRPRATARSTRCTGPSTRRSPSVLDGHPRLLAYDIHALGEGTDTIGARHASGSRRRDVAGERGAGEYAGDGQRAEHHRGLDRGLHRGPQHAARRGALAGRDRRPPATGKGVAVSAGTAREQRAELDEAEVPNDTTAWFER